MAKAEEYSPHVHPSIFYTVDRSPHVSICFSFELAFCFSGAKKRKQVQVELTVINTFTQGHSTVLSHSVGGAKLLPEENDHRCLHRTKF